MTTQFGSAVRSRRKALKWTQKALASRVGCTDAYISEIENQRKEPGDELRARLIDILDLRDLPQEDHQSTSTKIIAMPRSSPMALPGLDISPPSLRAVDTERDEDFEAHYREAFTQALTTAAIVGWKPTGADWTLSAAHLIGTAGLGLLAQGTLTPAQLSPGARQRRVLIKGPQPGHDRSIHNGRVEKEFYLRQTLPDEPGFGPPPALAYLPRTLFTHSAQTSFALPEQVAVLIFDLSQRHTALSPPQTLDQIDLMAQGVRSLRDLVNWCSVAHRLVATVLNIHNAGWTHRSLSPRNILIRTERGFHHDVRLIEFSAVARQGRPCEPFVDATELWHWQPERLEAWGEEGAPSRRRRSWTPEPRVEDVYALGAVLGQLLVGVSQQHTDNPEREERSWRAYMAQQRSDDLRFHIDEGRKHPERLPEPLRDELSRLYHLCHELLDTPRRVTIGRLMEHLDTIDHIRTRAQLLMTDWPGRSPDGPSKDPRARRSTSIEVLLRSMETHASTAQERDWCARHLEDDVDAIKRHVRPFPWLWRTLQRLDTPCPPDALNRDQAWADCREFLRLGFVRYASNTLTGLLRSGPTDNPERDAQMLRVAVGGLLIREENLPPVREILARFDLDTSAEPPFIGHLGRRRWWVELLKLRMALMEGARDQAAFLLETMPRPEPEISPRAWLWMLMVETLQALESGRNPMRQRESLVMARRWTNSTPESLFVTRLLARCDAARGDLGQALQWLHVGLGESTAREFPVEYALMLSLAATLIRDALDDPARRQRLHDQGEHPGAVLEVAGRLALRAGDMFQLMGMVHHLQQALIVAGDCARLQGAARDLTRAVTWYELARGNTALSPFHGPRMAQRRIELEHRLEVLERQWREDRSRPADPGMIQASALLDRHGPMFLALMGGQRLSPALADPGQPHLGLLLGDLIDTHVTQDPDTILDLGCGVGDDSRALTAHFPGAEIIGVDVSSWCIREARHRRQPGGRCAFHHIDVEALLKGRLHFGEPSLVIMRDTLRHVTFKRTFLRALRDVLPVGAIILGVEPIQTRVCGPGQWQRLMNASALTNLETLPGLMELLQESEYTLLTRAPRDHSVDLHALLQDRADWFHQARDREARMLAERPDAPRLVHRHLSPLLEGFAPGGVLGWIGFAAQLAS